jgi:regulation of enolase protein 1 (concanavalin A-like superfamily)
VGKRVIGSRALVYFSVAGLNSYRDRLITAGRAWFDASAIFRYRLGQRVYISAGFCVALACSVQLCAGGSDLSVTQSHTSGFMQGQANATYVITVTNAGTDPTTGMVSVTDSVPAGLTATCMAGVGWTCSQPAGPCTRTDTLDPAVSYPDLMLTVNVAPDAPETLINTVTVSQDGDTPGTTSTSDQTTVGAASTGGPMSDDFTSPTLNTTIWTFVNPQNDGSFSLNGSSLLLTAPAGNAHDVWTNGYNGVRVMQAIADADFDVEVKFGSAVSGQAPYQQEGVIVEQDPSNFLRFSVYSDDQRTILFAASVLGSSATVWVSQEIRAGPAIYMRIRRSGTRWRFSYSYDSIHWTPAFFFDQPIQVAKIGPYAGNSSFNGAPAPAFTAAVDYFVNRQFPPALLAGNSYPQPPAPPVINVWYGQNQTFGQNGVPQEWVNILGDVSDSGEVTSLTYSLNGGPEQPLWMGENEFRLVAPGEFNIELDYSQLNAGPNSLRISATDSLGYQSVYFVTVNYIQGQIWPVNYSINWLGVSNIESVVQVVDGRWQIQQGAVRTMETGYDRLIVMGDRNTWQQFVASVEVTINALDGHGFALGILAGWQGHMPVPYGPITMEEPNPYPAFGGYSKTYANPPALRIQSNSPTNPESLMAEDNSGRALAVGVKYIFKLQAQSNGLGGSHYKFKAWPAAGAEPPAWDLEADGDLSQGSVGLVADRADVSFGAITISGL